MRLAVESAAAACDHVVVFEGPAGDERCDEAPPSELEGLPVDYVRVGSWKTDASKRTAMVHYCRQYGEPTWAVWVDGDEVLENAAYLRDTIQAVAWRDNEEGAPIAGVPIRLVEADGSLAVCRAKVIRVDLVDRYLVSSSGILFRTGVTMAEGNLPQKISEWWLPERMQALESDRFVLTPPLPGEPFLVHRSRLRHPARVGLRMHAQEAQELDRLGYVPLDKHAPGATLGA